MFTSAFLPVISRLHIHSHKQQLSKNGDDISNRSSNQTSEVDTQDANDSSTIEGSYIRDLHPNSEVIIDENMTSKQVDTNMFTHDVDPGIKHENGISGQVSQTGNPTRKSTENKLYGAFDLAYQCDPKTEFLHSSFQTVKTPIQTPAAAIEPLDYYAAQNLNHLRVSQLPTEKEVHDLIRQTLKTNQHEQKNKCEDNSDVTNNDGGTILDTDINCESTLPEPIKEKLLDQASKSISHDSVEKRRIAQALGNCSG